MVSSSESGFKTPPNGKHVTVAGLAQERRLPANFLADLGLADLPGGGVSVPYYAEDGAELFTRERDRPGGPRFRQPSGVGLQPYGLWRLDEPRRAGHVYITEGESDAWTLWNAGMPALGLPGAQSARCLGAEHLAGIGTVYVCPDNDQAGRKMVGDVTDRLGAVGYRGRAYAVRLPPGFKDVSNVYQGDAPGFVSRWAQLVEQATPLLVPRRAASRGARSDTRPGAASDPKEWPDPIPLGAETSGPAFPLDCLPGWMGEWAAAEAEATQTPPDLAAMLLLSVGGAALAKKFRVEVREGWSEPTNLYTVTALPPGERKSAVFVAAMEPVEVYEAQEQDRMAPEIAEMASQRRTLELRQKALEQKVAKAANPSEVEAERDEAKALARELAAFRVPEPPEMWCDDVSAEKLANLLARQGERMLQASAEGTAFEIAKGRYSEAANFDVYLKGHSGDSLRVHRISRESDLLQSPALSMALTVQPDVIRGLADQPTMRQRGFLARFFYSLPKSLVGARKVEPPPVPRDVAEAYHDVMLRMWQLAGAVDDHGRPAPHWLRFSPEANGLMRDFQMWLEPQMGEGEDLSFLAGWPNKLAGAAARIAAIFHVAEALGTAQPWARPVGPETVEATLRLAKDYLLPHAQAAFGVMGADPRCDKARRAWVKVQSEYSEYSEDAPPRISRRDLHQLNRRLFPTAEEMEPALEMLVDHYYLIPEQDPGKAGRGHKSPKYMVNPLALALPREMCG
jgi:hypothetical protein